MNRRAPLNLAMTGGLDSREVQMALELDIENFEQVEVYEKVPNQQALE